jgi:hypothetical protein
MSPVTRSQVSPSPRKSPRIAEQAAKQAEPPKAISFGRTAPTHLFGAHAGAKTMALKDKVMANMMEEKAWQLIKEGKITKYDAYTKGMNIPDKHDKARARALLSTKTRKTGQERKGDTFSSGGTMYTLQRRYQPGLKSPGTSWCCDPMPRAPSGSPAGSARPSGIRSTAVWRTRSRPAPCRRSTPRNFSPKQARAAS